MQKILLITHNIYPFQVSGVELYVYHFAKELKRQGFDVTVVVPVFEENDVFSINSTDNDDFNLLTLVFPRGYHTVDNIFFNVQDKNFESFFSKFLEENRFDIVHFHHCFGYPFSIIDVAGFYCKTVLTLHDFWNIALCIGMFREGNVCDGPKSTEKCLKCTFNNFESFDLDKQKYLTGILDYRNSFNRYLFNKISYVSAPTYFVKEYYNEFCPDIQVDIKPLGVYSVNKIKKGFNKNNLKFCFIGSLTENKNPYLLVEAFKKSRISNSLEIWGQGSDENLQQLKLEIGSADNIQYKGTYKHTELNAILSNVDVVVVPSQVETYCLTLREALFAGKLVIASDIPAVLEIVEDRKNGIIFKSNDVDSLCGALMNVLENDIINKIEPNSIYIPDISEDVKGWVDIYINL